MSNLFSGGAEKCEYVCVYVFIYTYIFIYVQREERVNDKTNRKKCINSLWIWINRI